VETGLILAGGDAGETAALVEGNVLRGVTVADDDVTARGTAVVVQGGGAFGLPLGGPFFLSGMEFPGYRQAGTVTRNTVAELTFSGNRFEALDGTVVLGALSTATEDRLRENVVRSLTFKGNRFVTSRSSITAIAGLVMTSGTVVQSAVAGVHGTGNLGPTGLPIAPVTLAEATLAGAPPTSVAGNTVTDVTVE
jgi:hypothetical protein